MKILMLTDKMDIGGAETHIFTLSKELTQLGHSVTVASLGGCMVSRLLTAGVVHVELPLGEKNLLALLKSLAGIRRLLKNENFDLIHSHARGASLICSLEAQRRGLPLVTTVHARFSLSPIRRRMSRWGEGSIAVSQDLKQYLCREYHIAPQNVSVIENGIDMGVFCPDNGKKAGLHSVKRDFLRILFLSRLDRDCSVCAELLCELAPELYGKLGYFEIVIGGSGEELKRIKELARKANRKIGKPCIRLVGEVRDVPEFLRSGDIFAGVSRAALEAACCGLSVILCGNEGFFGRLTADRLSEASLGNFCGRGCETADGEALYEELYALMKMSAHTRALEEAKLREALAKGFDSRGMAWRTESFYKSVVERRGRAGSGVLLCGYYGFGNMGDDALLRFAAKRAASEFKGEGICALTKGGKRDYNTFGIRCVSRSNPVSIIREISKCKYFILGGGTLIQTATSRRSALYYVGLLKLAKSMGADCRMWGNGLGGCTDGYSQGLIRSGLSVCSYIGLRDSSSLSKAAWLLPRHNAVCFDDDLAYRCGPSEQARIDFLEAELFGKKHRPPFLLVAPKGRDLMALEQMRHRLDEESQNGLFLVFVAMYERQDGELCRALCREYGGALLKGADLCDLVGLAARSRGVLSARFHALVAAKRAGVHLEGFGDDPKIREFSSWKRT